MIFSYPEAKKFYDSFGKKQDWQGFYENKAINKLIENSNFENAGAVFEFGCGTGKFARDLLENYLAGDCRYLGVDLSETMIKIASGRLRSFEPRAAVQLSDGSPELNLIPGSCDRFISSYVLDILSDEDITVVFSEARRILPEKGLLCLTSLTGGSGIVSRPVSVIWEAVHRLKPDLVGGCRPLKLTDFVDEADWHIKHHSKVRSFGVTSEILVAEKN
jgi:SAM-dependent methyltransferase